ncbi:unnamed protein product [Cuscuta campestris]|uniref:Calpain catalytic domain-containing protein n=1 Tax=Cuscuta campestris TaxID=132261 RepID=A0A484NQ69_9ASTE|nr:unnamed protein product [Cuscuta campestris]
MFNTGVPLVSSTGRASHDFEAMQLWIYSLDAKHLCWLASFVPKGVLFAYMSLFAGSVVALGVIVSAKPLDDLGYKGLTVDQNVVTSPYASSVYLGWAVASAIALLASGLLPIISWFVTYRFPLSSGISIGVFAAVLVAFCSVSYLKVVSLRVDQVLMKEDFLAALLPLLCIFAVLSLSSGLFKWKDDNWKLYRGAYIFIIIGLLLQLGAISAIIVTVHPWRIGATFLLVLLLLVLAIGAIHYWASNNFYLKRVQMLVVCFLAFLVALAAFLVGWFQDKAFVCASVGYFSFLFLLAGRALSVPPFTFDSSLFPKGVTCVCVRCTCRLWEKRQVLLNSSLYAEVLEFFHFSMNFYQVIQKIHVLLSILCGAFLLLYGVALAIEGWGVVASLKIYPPSAGAAVSAITLVVAFGFALSRPCLTLELCVLCMLLRSGRVIGEIIELGYNHQVSVAGLDSFNFQPCEAVLESGCEVSNVFVADSESDFETIFGNLFESTLFFTTTNKENMIHTQILIMRAGRIIQISDMVLLKTIIKILIKQIGEI